MYESTYMKRTARIISGVCGSLFILFIFFYLFVMQADLLVVKGADGLFSAMGGLYHYIVAIVVASFVPSAGRLSAPFLCTQLFPVLSGIGNADVYCAGQGRGCLFFRQLDMVCQQFCSPCLADMGLLAFPGPEQRKATCFFSAMG